MTTNFPRLKPDPIPTVRPVPEYAVEGQRAEWYAEMKAALQVPWMGVVTMAFAHYPNLFAELWRGLKPLVGSEAFVSEAHGLQAMVEAAAADLAPPAITNRLIDSGYGEREIDQIRAVNAVFSHGNHAYAMIAATARLLLEGGEMTGAGGDAPQFSGRHAPDVDVPFMLMEAHHADAPTRATYDDIMAVLGLPFVNTDYRAFARWPSYWAAGWGDLRAVAASPACEAICQRYHNQAVGAVRDRLPNPGGLSGATLRDAAGADAPLDEVIEVVRLFQWLLPGLATNVAYLKLQLEDI